MPISSTDESVLFKKITNVLLYPVIDNRSMEKNINWREKIIKTIRAVARNLLRGTNRGSGDGSPPAGCRGRAPVEVWGRNPQKPETHAEYSTEQSHRS